VSPVTTDQTVQTEEVPTSRRLRADAARNQQRILDAARDLFATRGLEITLDDVAEHAGVGVGTVYRRFANKHELIYGVFEQNVDMMAEQAEFAYKNPDPWLGLVEFFEYACQNMAANRGLGDVILMLENSTERFAAVKERMQPAVQRIFDRAMAAGVIRPDAEAGDLFALIHMVDGFADFSRSVNPNAWRRYFAIILDGLRADCVSRDPLPVPALTDDEIHEAKTACFGRRR
jgi:AcrR family transcriptional regulator